MSIEAEFSIPPLPHILLKVLQYDYSSPDASAVEMERIIEPDKSICSEILRVANSAYYGRSGKIRSLRDAITLMGLRVLKNLVIYISTRQMTGHLSQPIYRKYLHEFPVVSALLARDLAVRLKNREIADEAFLVALLHKIGMSILALKKSDEYARLLRRSEETGADLRSSERELFGTDHVQLGQMAAMKWNLPGELAMAMAADTGMEPRECSALQRITLLSSFMGARITEIPLPINVTEMIDNNPDALGIDRNTWDEFLSPEFVGRLKEHPYYQLTAS